MLKKVPSERSDSNQTLKSINKIYEDTKTQQVRKQKTKKKKII